MEPDGGRFFRIGAREPLQKRVFRRNPAKSDGQQRFGIGLEGGDLGSATGPEHDGGRISALGPILVELEADSVRGYSLAPWSLSGAGAAWMAVIKSLCRQSLHDAEHDGS